MDFQIITENGETLEYLTVLPFELKHYKIFAQVNVFLGTLGTLAHQSLPLSKFTILYHDYLIKRNVAFYKKLASSLLVLHIIYKNNLHYHDIQGIGKIKFREGQFNLLYLPFLNAKMQLEKGDYATFCIHFSKDYLKPFIKHMPALEGFLRKVEENDPCQLCSTHPYASAGMREVINTILDSENHDELNELYIEGKVQELLILAIKKMKSKTRNNYFLSENDTEQIEKIKEWLDENMNHTGTLRQMARNFGLNGDKLNRGFQQVFGNTVFNYILKIRMEKAKKLLLETDKSITEIAYEIGYSRISTFTRAFRKYFKYAPNYLRKE